MITIQPAATVLERWSNSFSTERDVWYWDESLTDIDTSGSELLQRREYLEHPTYSDISYVNAYWHWRMPRSVEKVLTSDPEWIGSLSIEDRSRVLTRQVELDRGLIVPHTHFDAIPDSLLPYVVDDKIVLSREAWMSLEPAVQSTALDRERLGWDDAKCLPITEGTPDHIRAIANTYGDGHGANCLATTAYCITGNDATRHTWMFQPTFIAILEEHGYVPVKGIATRAGDVITFTNNDTIVHATWCVSEDRFINKNGQSMFNPVRVVNRAMLDADWPETKTVIYRNTN